MCKFKSEIFFDKPPLKPVRLIVLIFFFFADFIALIMFGELPDELIVIKTSFSFPI